MITLQQKQRAEFSKFAEVVLREQKRGLKSNFKSIFTRNDDLDAEFDRKLAKINAEMEADMARMKEDFAAMVMRKGGFE